MTMANHMDFKPVSTTDWTVTGEGLRSPLIGWMYVDAEWHPCVFQHGHLRVVESKCDVEASAWKHS
jgi:hypothetical protein